MRNSETPASTDDAQTLIEKAKTKGWKMTWQPGGGHYVFRPPGFRWSIDGNDCGPGREIQEREFWQKVASILRKYLFEEPQPQFRRHFGLDDA